MVAVRGRPLGFERQPSPPTVAESLTQNNNIQPIRLDEPRLNNLHVLRNDLSYTARIVLDSWRVNCPVACGVAFQRI